MPQNGQEFIKLFAFDVGGYFDGDLAVNLSPIVLFVFEGDFDDLN